MKNQIPVNRVEIQNPAENPSKSKNPEKPIRVTVSKSNEKIKHPEPSC